MKDFILFILFSIVVCSFFSDFSCAFKMREVENNLIDLHVQRV